MRLFLPVIAALTFVLSACDTVVVKDEVLEFESDSTFIVNRFISKLPILMLETDGKEIPDKPRITALLTVFNNDEGRFNQFGYGHSDHEGSIEMERRGSTSQNFPKKQFAFETQDVNGAAADIELLGLPAENDWILHAPYSDKSMLRNALMYKWWRDLGRYASRTRFCEVVINGSYEGIYVLMEQIKWDAKRVDIEKPGTDDNGGDGLTGGYIFKVDKTSGGDDGFDWTSRVETFEGVKANVAFQYDYPQSKDITPQQAAYLQRFVHGFEQSLLYTGYREGNADFRSFADVGSFIDFFILQEIAHNADGYRNSTYLHKKRDSNGGKLHMGPIWDFNLALGNTTGCEGDRAEGWALDHPCDPTVIPFWWKRMMQDTGYSAQLSQRWWELRSDVLSDDRLMADIDRMAGELGEAIDRNDHRWKLFGNHIWPNNFVGNDHAEEIDYLKNWLKERLKWMDANIPQPG